MWDARKLKVGDHVTILPRRLNTAIATGVVVGIGPRSRTVSQTPIYIKLDSNGKQVSAPVILVTTEPVQTDPLPRLGQ